VTRAFVSVGSNIDPAANTEQALRLLGCETRITNISTVYETEAEGRPEQPRYYNCVAEIDTTLPPRDLKLHVLRKIEKKLGRKRGSDKFAARTIDLDLVLYDELVLAAEALTLPDPDITRRPFLAIPLHELAPALVLPGSGVRIAEVARAMTPHHMMPLEDYTKLLRKEIFTQTKNPFAAKERKERREN
jgi:2-amino-4-hydroxy-6-hydroxymethyldihydropteridine diphosphokinase